MQQSPDSINQVLNTQIKSIHQLTDNILKRVRLSGKTNHGILFDFKQNLQLLIKTILSSSIAKYFEREDMLELLGYLLDNAFKWSSKNIIIDIQKNQDCYIVIEGDGPGCDEKLLNQLAQRGNRMDESVQGHEFGLAIAREIVEEYDGQITFTRSQQLHGFKVQIIIYNKNL